MCRFTGMDKDLSRGRQDDRSTLQADWIAGKVRISKHRQTLPFQKGGKQWGPGAIAPTSLVCYRRFVRDSAAQETTMVGWIVLAVLVVIAFMLVGMYNSLVQLRVRCDNAWSDIDVQLKRRHD